MQVSQLTDFLKAIRQDNRITTSHISVYVTLFEFWNENQFKNPVSITRRQVMQAAKINGIATFHKCIRDLDELRYIKYMPSRNPAIHSQVELLKL